MDIISRINWVDVLVVTLMVRMSYVAFRDGLSHEIFPFIGSIIILVLGLYYYTRIGNAVSTILTDVRIDILYFFSFLALVVALGFIVRLLRVVLDKIVKVEWHPLVEKFGGLVVGIGRAYIITCIVLTVLALSPLSYLQWSIRDKSLTGKYVLRAGPEIYARIVNKPLKSVAPKPDRKQKIVPAEELY